MKTTSVKTFSNRFLLLTSLIILLAASVSAATINVPVDHATIQDAIDAATAGDTITVDSGTYNECDITIDKALTLEGAQANVDPRPSEGGRVGPETIIDGEQSCSSLIIVTVPDVEINGFQIQFGTGDMVRNPSATPVDNLVFHYNILRDNTSSDPGAPPGDEGIQIRSSDNVNYQYNYAYDIRQDAFNFDSTTNSFIQDNEIYNDRSDNGAINVYGSLENILIQNNLIRNSKVDGAAILVGSSGSPENVDVIGNTLSGITSNDGIKIDDGGNPGGEVRDNILYDMEEDGIVIYSDDVIVDGNEIYDAHSSNAAIYLYRADNVTVTNNNVHNNSATGIEVRDSNDVLLQDNIVIGNDGVAGILLDDDVAGFLARDNIIEGNANFGMKNEWGTLVDASENWWGDATGPSGEGSGNGDAVSVDIDFSPWYTTDALSGLTYVVDGVSFTTIQDAIDAASDGDTVFVEADTYTENLAINKEVTLIGEDTATTIIEGTHTITSDSVQVESFTFDPAAGTAITIDSSASTITNVNILDSLFDLDQDPSVGIHVGGSTPTDELTDITIEGNEFVGPANKICNPWKIGGSFGAGLDVTLTGLDFVDNEVDSCSIPINLQNGDLDDIFVDGNEFTNTDGALYIWSQTGSSPSGVLSNFVFSNNNLDSTNAYGVGIDGAPVGGPELTDANFGSGNEVTRNKFVGIAGAYGFDSLSYLASISQNLSAEENWWGDQTGPTTTDNPGGSGDDISLNIDFDPWCTNEDCTATATIVGSGSSNGLSDIINKIWGLLFSGTDSDGDGLSDADELAAGTDPNRDNTDGDCLLDGADPSPTDNDANNDGEFDGC